eukprot:CAMPEP_0202453570 /NCGR_PEP_ID=MMETSP1360-20130828/11517_1 /ASSEMBLY_ACC=CAM_ASM_000848 /TAXON_ID=515479 /ORGANISM="Licmophora paradoxa, Strain CCMP2313" /LENGTH=144 /DNA_ID=CAMNT_0049072705 /DNA_START=107 /DNA_END=541 /DNA_ORIENTATION=+
MAMAAAAAITAAGVTPANMAVVGGNAAVAHTTNTDNTITLAPGISPKNKNGTTILTTNHTTDVMHTPRTTITVNPIITGASPPPQPMPPMPPQGTLTMQSQHQLQLMQQQHQQQQVNIQQDTAVAPRNQQDTREFDLLHRFALP